VDFPLEESELRKLKKVPQEPNTWEALKVPAKSIMKNPPRELAEAEVVIWGDLSAESIRNMQFVCSDDGNDLAQSLATAIMGVNRSIPPSRPQKVIVRDRRLMLYCRGLLRNLSIDCEFSGGPSVFDQVIRDLGSELAKFEPLSDQDFLPLENQASRLWDVAPWRFLKETEVIRIRFENRDEAPELYAVTVGGGIGVHLGVLFFRDRSKIERLFESGSKMTLEEQAANFENCYSVTFDADNSDDERLGATAKDEPISAPRLSIAVVDCDVDLRPLKDKFEIHTVQAAISAYIQFVEKHRAQLEAGRYPENWENFYFEDDAFVSRGLNHVKVMVDGGQSGEAIIEGAQSLQTDGLIPVEGEIYPVDESNRGEEDFEPRIIDMRAGRYSLTLETLTRDFLENLAASKAFFTPPLLALYGKSIPTVRLHLPKRRALNMIDALSDLSLDELIAIEINTVDESMSTVVTLTDHLERVILGSLEDASMNLAQFTQYFNIPTGGHKLVAVVVTYGSARPDVAGINQENLCGAFLCVADRHAIERIEHLDT
jgi:hypothetical protein